MHNVKNFKTGDIIEFRTNQPEHGLVLKITAKHFEVLWFSDGVINRYNLTYDSFAFKILTI